MTVLCPKQSAGPAYYVGFAGAPDQLYLVTGETPLKAALEAAREGNRWYTYLEEGDTAFVYAIDHESSELSLVGRFRVVLSVAEDEGAPAKDRSETKVRS